MVERISSPSLRRFNCQWGLLAQGWRTLGVEPSLFGARMHTLGLPKSFVNLTGFFNQGWADAFNGV